MSCHHISGDPSCSCADDFDSALDRWIGNLTVDERRAYATGLGVDPDGDAFEPAMAGLYADHLCSDPFERDAYPAPPAPKATVLHLIDRLLRAAYAAGMNGDEFDMLAARREVEATETEQTRG